MTGMNQQGAAAGSGACKAGEGACAAAAATFDKKAFRSLSYGLYIVTAACDDVRAGCVVNTFAQVTSTPPQASIAINKENFTAGVIGRAGMFEVSVLAQDAPMELIGRFGFRTSADTDKFGDTRTAQDAAGIPYVAEHAVAHFCVKVAHTLDLGTHLYVVGEVVESSVLSHDEPMTYAYYHQAKGGKTPSKAPSFEGDAAPAAQGVGAAAQGAAASREGADAPAKGGVAASEAASAAPSDAPAAHAQKAGNDPSADAQSGGEGAAAKSAEAPRAFAWRCTICGHIEYVDELPDDFACPICGVGKEMFERIEL